MCIHKYNLHYKVPSQIKHYKYLSKAHVFCWKNTGINKAKESPSNRKLNFLYLMDQ